VQQLACKNSPRELDHPLTVAFCLDHDQRALNGPLTSQCIKDDNKTTRRLSSKNMANVVRPRVPAATAERQTRLNFQPIRRTPDDALNNSPSSAATIATRRTSKGNQLLALGDDEKLVKQITLTPPKAAAAPLARTNSRKRPLADATTPDTRPPTKITVTQPHGELLRITNGVSAPLGIDVDDVPSGRSTPRPGSAGKSTPAAGSHDKRSLRSHDGGSRLKSDLATYFASYDDIIAGVSKPAGT
jgi:hypothetical protein